MAQTLPSDLYDPVNALRYASYQFYENLGVMNNLMSTSGSAPVKFNANRAILQSGGAYLHAPVLKPMTTIETRRDLTSTSDATPIAIQSRDDIGVRVSRKLGPASFTKSAQWLSGLRGGELEQFFATEAVNRMMLSMRNFVLATAKAAISNMTSTLHTKSVWNASTRTNLTSSLLASTRALLGDRSQIFEPGSGAGWVFRSESFYTDLCQFQLTQGVTGIADKLSNGGGPLTLGLPYAIADDAALTTADAGFDKYYTLLLGAGAIEIDLINLEFTPLWMNPKAENVEFVLRGDYDFEVRIPGFKWDTSGGGSNPTLTTAGTAAYWVITYSDHREIPMAVAEHNYSGN